MSVVGISARWISGENYYESMSIEFVDKDVNTNHQDADTYAVIIT